MTAYIVVVDTPHFATTSREGQVTLSGLPAGKYAVHVWHPDLQTEPAPITLSAMKRETLSFTMR